MCLYLTVYSTNNGSPGWDSRTEACVHGVPTLTTVLCDALITFSVIILGISD